MSLVGKDETEALQKLKQASLAEVEEMHQENGRLQSQNHDLVFNLDQQKSLLDRTLIGLSEQLDETKVSSGDLKSTLDMLNAATKGRHAGAQGELEQRLSKQQDELQADKEKLASHAEV